ncbi:hypothetical protein BKA70DRAFT_181423 [Coprinopsis sp. MPI-PUGE-AT-0042]|nr:hypothetical protein BKA70DRAFT_181423 [Coprinopsis sp. MPI-PUGE-AT-0042]
MRQDIVLFHIPKEGPQICGKRIRLLTIASGYSTGGATNTNTKVFPLNGFVSRTEPSKRPYVTHQRQVDLMVNKHKGIQRQPLLTYSRPTRNYSDSVNTFGPFSRARNYGPVFRIDFLGGAITQGLVECITIVQLPFYDDVRGTQQPDHSS